MNIHADKIYTSEDYWNLPDGKRAELIDGKFYDIPMPNRIHQTLVGELSFKIANYIDNNASESEIIFAPFAVNLTGDEKTWVEPDIIVVCNKNKLSERACECAPDWIIEIVMPETAEHDYIDKLCLYYNAGVREYWIVDPIASRVTVYYPEAGVFAQNYSFEETIPVNIYDDFAIDFSALNI